MFVCPGYSCEDSYVIELNSTQYGDIVCSASESCQSSKKGIYLAANNGSNIYCGGYRSCYNNDIYVSPHYKEALIGQNKIYCGGVQSCAESNISNAHTVYCSGRNSCQRTKINMTSNIYVLSSSESTDNKTNMSISNGAGLEMKVYFYNVFGAQGTNVDCENEDCYVQCKYPNSCYDVTVKCGTYCQICCNDTIGVTCPTDVQIGFATIEYTSYVLLFFYFFWFWFCFLLYF